MLHVVIKASDETIEEDIATTNASVPKSLLKNVQVHIWRPSKTQATTATLATFLRDMCDDDDFVIIVKPGTIFSRRALARLINPKWSDSANRIRLIERKGDVHWIGTALIAVQYDLLTQITFNFRTYRQDDRARYFLSALRYEWWYSTIKANITTPEEVELSKMTTNDPRLYDKAWYLDFQKHWYELLKSHEVAPPATQRAYLYMLSQRLRYNMNGANKFVLRGKDIDTFYSYVKRNLKYIDDRVLLRYMQVDMNTRLFLLKMKYPNVEDTYQYSSRNILRAFNGNQVDNAAKSRITIESMDFYDDKLVIAGFTPFVFDPANAYLVCRCDDIEYELSDAHRYGSLAIFGREVYRNRTFTISIPADVVRKTKMISFHIMSNNRKTDVRQHLTFTRAMSKLNNAKYAYWQVKGLDKILKYKGRVIWVTSNSLVRRVYHELRYLRELFFHSNSSARKAALLRVLYILTRRLFRSPVWVSVISHIRLAITVSIYGIMLGIRMMV